MKWSPSNQGDCRLVIGDLHEDLEELVKHVEVKAFDYPMTYYIYYLSLSRLSENLLYSKFFHFFYLSRMQKTTFAINLPAKTLWGWQQRRASSAIRNTLMLRSNLSKAPVPLLLGGVIRDPNKMFFSSLVKCSVLTYFTKYRYMIPLKWWFPALELSSFGTSWWACMLKCRVVSCNLQNETTDQKCMSPFWRVRRWMKAPRLGFVANLTKIYRAQHCMITDDIGLI